MAQAQQSSFMQNLIDTIVNRKQMQNVQGTPQINGVPITVAPPNNALTGIVQQSAPAQTPQPVIQTPQPTLLDRVGSGINQFISGYNENYNDDYDVNNLYNNRFSKVEKGNSQKLKAYQDSLRQNGVDENIINAVAQGKNSGNKDIANWISQNPDAFDKTTYTDKTTLGRAGEAFGSIAKIAQNPTAQMLIAALISKKFNPRANWANALENGYKYGQMAGERFSNQNVANQLGYDVNNSGIFGGINKDALNALYRDEYYKRRTQNDADKIAGQLDRWLSQNLTDRINANNGSIKASASQTNANANMYKAKNGVTINHNKQDNNNNNSNLASDMIRLQQIMGEGDDARTSKAIEQLYRHYNNDFLNAYKKMFGISPFGG